MSHSLSGSAAEMHKPNQPSSQAPHPGGTQRCSQDSCLPRDLLPIGHAWNTSPKRRHISIREASPPFIDCKGLHNKRCSSLQFLKNEWARKRGSQKWNESPVQCIPSGCCSFKGTEEVITTRRAADNTEAPSEMHSCALQVHTAHAWAKFPPTNSLIAYINLHHITKDVLHQNAMPHHFRPLF